MRLQGAYPRVVDALVPKLGCTHLFYKGSFYTISTASCLLIQYVYFVVVDKTMEIRDKLEKQSFIVYLEIITHILPSLLLFKSLLCFFIILCHCLTKTCYQCTSWLEKAMHRLMERSVEMGN